jgi:hypothetical protein
MRLKAHEEGQRTIRYRGERMTLSDNTIGTSLQRIEQVGFFARIGAREYEMSNKWKELK